MWVYSVMTIATLSVKRLSSLKPDIPKSIQVWSYGQKYRTYSLAVSYIHLRYHKREQVRLSPWLATFVKCHHLAKSGSFLSHIFLLPIYLCYYSTLPILFKTQCFTVCYLRHVVLRQATREDDIVKVVITVMYNLFQNLFWKVNPINTNKT